jgi:molybdate transport system substrate-binding protein
MFDVPRSEFTRSCRLRNRLREVAAGLVLGVAACFPAMASAGDVTVFAAASTKNAMDEIVAAFTAETGHDVTMVYAGSSTLARQIAHGAPADIFLSASVDWMNVLAADGKLDLASRSDLLGNTLVVIAHGRDAPPVALVPAAGFLEALGGGRLAMALVDAVPAGVYGKAALQSLGLWDALASRVAQLDNVRAALALVAAGEAPLGIVYASDASAEDAVTIVATFPAETHPPIVYPVAAVAGRSSPVALRFLDFLREPTAQVAFLRQRFRVLVE